MEQPTEVNNLENVVGKEKLKKIDTVLKKFIAKNKTDPDYLKAYIRIDDVDFCATDKSNACMIMFRNKYDARHTGIHYYQEHEKAFKKVENQAAIDEISTNYPDVPALYHRLDLTDYDTFEVNQKEVEDLIKINDAMIDICKMKGVSPVCEMTMVKDVYFKVKGVKDMSFEYKLDKEGSLTWGESFTYNPELLANILKSIKELKKFVDKAIFYMKDKNRIVVRAVDVDYEYTFMLARKTGFEGELPYAMYLKE